MTIGTGVAIAGLWVFVGLLGLSPRVSNFGITLGFVTAVGFTIALM